MRFLSIPRNVCYSWIWLLADSGNPPETLLREWTLPLSVELTTFFASEFVFSSVQWSILSDFFWTKQKLSVLYIHWNLTGLFCIPFNIILGDVISKLKDDARVIVKKKKKSYCSRHLGNYIGILLVFFKNIIGNKCWVMMT